MIVRRRVFLSRSIKNMRVRLSASIYRNKGLIQRAGGAVPVPLNFFSTSAVQSLNKRRSSVGMLGALVPLGQGLL